VGWFGNAKARTMDVRARAQNKGSSYGQRWSGL
jgi:hypothetical protein